jgi:hypothetical protein
MGATLLDDLRAGLAAGTTLSLASAREGIR